MSDRSYSVVIATFERSAELRDTLQSLAAQSALPTAVIVVDSSRDPASRDVCSEFQSRLPISYQAATEPSAAKQRNQGAASVRTPLVAFVDDDVKLPPDTFAKLCEVFANDPAQEIGGVSARIEGLQHTPPRGLLWLYYRLQAGFNHPTFGGKLFGPGINCLPSYLEREGTLIAADWLPSTCVLFRTELFEREKFPAFDGYSFLEDVHLSARIGRTHRLLFHAGAIFQHLDAPSSHKRNVRRLAQMRMRNSQRVAREILGQRGVIFAAKVFLLRAFASIHILRNRRENWRDELIGTWT